MGGGEISIGCPHGFGVFISVIVPIPKQASQSSSLGSVAFIVFSVKGPIRASRIRAKSAESNNAPLALAGIGPRGGHWQGRYSSGSIGTSIPATGNATLQWLMIF
jgi:hypothetical protein